MAQSLDETARQILRDNDRGGYTVPTAGLYPYQWNWDSCFAALGFATFDLKRAWFEISTLFMAQWDDGMVPHIVFHQRVDGYFPGPEIWGTDRVPPTSGITQPPVAATVVRSLYETDKAAGRMHLEQMFTPLMDWHRWFMTHRLRDGMVTITHPWESGRDNAADWDGAMANVSTDSLPEALRNYTRRDTTHVDADMRPKKHDYDRYLTLLAHGRDTGWDAAKIAETAPFLVADVAMTFILLRACRDLLALAVELGHDTGEIQTSEIQGWITTLEAGAQNHWNPKGFYDSRDMRTGAFTDALGSGGCLCWYAGLESPDMRRQLERMLAAAPYGLASLDPEDPRFDGPRYWRGPVWAIVNAMAGIGLADLGHDALAERLRADTRALIETSGFYEYFNPRDGAPAGGGAFTWTAAIWLAWAGPNAKGRL